MVKQHIPFDKILIYQNDTISFGGTTESKVIYMEISQNLLLVEQEGENLQNLNGDIHQIVPIDRQRRTGYNFV